MVGNDIIVCDIRETYSNEGGYVESCLIKKNVVEIFGARGCFHHLILSQYTNGRNIKWGRIMDDFYESYLGTD